MARRLLFLGVLAASLAAPGIRAQTAPGTPNANPIDPASVEALKAMGTYLQTLKRFQVTSEVTGERVLSDGQKLQHTAMAKLDVARPNRLRVAMSSPRSQRDLYYDGKAVTLYVPTQKFYRFFACDLSGARRSPAHGDGITRTPALDVLTCCCIETFR